MGSLHFEVANMRAFLGLFLVLLLVSASQEQNPPAAECTKVEKLPTEPTTQEEFLELLEQMLQDVLVIFDAKKKEFTIELDANPIDLPGSAFESFRRQRMRPNV